MKTTLPIPFKTDDTSRIGKFGIANSAGLVDWHKGGSVFTKITEARTVAKVDSAGGWLGDCWVVIFVPNED